MTRGGYEGGSFKNNQLFARHGRSKGEVMRGYGGDSLACDLEERSKMQVKW